MLSALRNASPVSEAASEYGADNAANRSDRALLTKTPTRNMAIFNSNHGKGMECGQNGSHSHPTVQGRRTFAFWTLVVLLLILAVGNLLLTVTIVTVLKLGQGMESIEVVPEAATIKFFGLTDLGHLYKRDGLIRSFLDSPMELRGEMGGSVVLNAGAGVSSSRPGAKLAVGSSSGGISVTGVSSMKVVSPTTGQVVFSTSQPSFKLKDGTKNLNAKMISTRRIAAPLDESLKIKSDSTITFRGAEGTHIESKEMTWYADQDVILLATNGSVLLSGREGVFVDVRSLPGVEGGSGANARPQYKLCVCMPQGKIFRISAQAGLRTSCSHINMSNKYNPCI